MRRLQLVSCSTLVGIAVVACGPLPGYRTSPNLNALAPVNAAPTTAVTATDLPPPATPGAVSSAPLNGPIPLNSGYPTNAAPGAVYPQTAYPQTVYPTTAQPGQIVQGQPVQGQPVQGQPASLGAQAQQLATTGVNPVQTPPLQQATTQPTGVAGLPPTLPAAGAGSINAKDLGGTWNLAAAGESCKISFSLTGSLTKGVTGYHATPLKCTSDELKSVNIWSVENNQLVLKDAGGKTIALLNQAAPKRLSGATAATHRGVQLFQ